MPKYSLILQYESLAIYLRRSKHRYQMYEVTIFRYHEYQRYGDMMANFEKRVHCWQSWLITAANQMPACADATSVATLAMQQVNRPLKSHAPDIRSVTPNDIKPFKVAAADCTPATFIHWL